MVWGGISVIFGKLNLYIKKHTESINSEVHINQILAVLVKPLATTSLILVQDGATSHTSKKTKLYLDNENIRFKNQSPKSPDLNPIEKIWSILKFYVEKKAPSDKNMLIEAIQDRWNSISKETIEKTIFRVTSRKSLRC